jgi:thiol-disulfide isomerase/thioredoxin
LFFCAEASLCPAAPQSKPKAPAKAPAADPALIDQKGFRELLERYRGKPLLVNFWATWCQPCHTEYPMINELARQYAPRGLVVLGISFDEDAEINLVRHFLERNRPIFHNYRKRPGEEMAFARSVNPRWNGTIPATFFYSRDGRELAHFIGTRSRAEFEIAIREALETKTNSPGH